MKAEELIHHLAEMTRARRCLLVTSETCGNPALAGVSLVHFDTLVSLQYAKPDDPNLEGPIKQTAETVAGEVERLGQFDVAFLDPYHSYSASRRELQLFVASAADHGWTVVHDCYPPPELTPDSYVDGAWCGSTYAAFRDVVSPTDRAWFVIDTDFGLGVIGPQGSARCIVDECPEELVTRWTAASIEHKRDLLQSSGRELLRVVSVGVAIPLLERLMAGETVRFPDDGVSPSPTAPTPSPDARSIS